MGSAQTDLQAMIDFRSHLMRFNKTLDDEYHGMAGAWKSLEGVWHDEKYRQFGDALGEVGRGIDAYLAATEDHERHLLRLIEAIDQYLQVR
jgi:hypothetical protein